MLKWLKDLSLKSVAFLLQILGGGGAKIPSLGNIQTFKGCLYQLRVIICWQAFLVLFLWSLSWWQHHKHCHSYYIIIMLMPLSKIGIMFQGLLTDKALLI